MPVTVKTACDERELRITIRRGSPRGEEEVTRMFDAKGSETHDPIEAVEVECEDGLYQIECGDKITVTVEV